MTLSIATNGDTGLARLESIAVAGYYPTPPSVVPLIAKRLDSADCGAFLDPCCGDGAAVLALMRELGLSRKADLHVIELEKTRHEALTKNINEQLGYSSSRNALHGDAFFVAYQGKGVTCLYLNPPYDIDPEHGRLEQKFLARFADALAPGGVLIFLVPYYALKASAETLATHFEDVRCYRFPDVEFAAYKQVVLYARKRTTILWQPDPAIVDAVVSWAADAANTASLDEATDEPYSLPSVTEWYRAFEHEWRLLPLDLRGVLDRTSPWSMTDRGGRRTPVPGIIPEGALDDLLVRRYPLAMPPRPAHIAAGIAAGVFNGARIGPDDGAATRLPELLVKGVFDKEFRTVDEKKDKDGTTKAVVQVQQPKLVTTVLDLSTSRYITVKSSGELTGSSRIDDFTMADLLAKYGHGLMQVMLQQCPVMHEPTRDAGAFELPELARPLFHAQHHAVMAAVKLLGGPDAPRRSRRRRAAFVLGEIGSGKTSVAIATARAIDSRRTLVMCPPHLLDSWRDQVALVAPDVKCVVLNDVTDVQALAADGDPFHIIAILSRETAKLGHAYAGLERCGDCGALAPADTAECAKKRLRCEGQRLVPRGALGRLVIELAQAFARVFPGDMRVRQLVDGAVRAGAERWAETATTDKGWTEREWPRAAAMVDRVVDRLTALISEDSKSELREALELLLWAEPRPERALRAARALYAKRPTKESWSTPDVVQSARRILLPVPGVDFAEFKALDNPEWSRYGAEPWGEWQKLRDTMARAGSEEDSSIPWNPYGISRSKEGVVRGAHGLGDRRAALDALVMLANATLMLSEPCDAPLFQAIPEPRRYPLATFIAKKHRTLFDLLVLDEGHEYATDGSAQERSAHRLTSLGIPTLLLTGTIMNGYAESMFTNMWALSPDFRREFARDERQRFIDRYGYRKRLVEDRDKESGKVVAYGSMSDRVESSERMIGDAPGVLPVFLLRYLLPMSVTLHKTDLAIDIPKCTEVTEHVEPATKQGSQFRSLQTRLLAQIARDRFQEGLAGKLWGALAELPGYLDCATEDVGNTDDGRYEIRYPESAGGGLVAAADPLPAGTLLPKERWLIEHLESAFAADRRVLIFAWHTRLLARIARLVKKHTKQECPILEPSKVPTKKRQAWIDSEVIAKKRRVLVCNPITVQTGLNNLVYFADEAWLENPACNPVVYRQAVGRVDRIGQRLPTRIVFPLYTGTLQVELHSLLMQKVGVSMSADGLDGESAMAAAGIGDDGGFSAFSVGRQLYELLTKEKKVAA